MTGARCSTAGVAARITFEILTKLPDHFPCRVWRRNVGVAVRGDYRVRFGVAGEADVTGIIYICGHGHRLEIEVKAPGDKLSPDQISFREMIRDHGGIFIEARSFDQVVTELAAHVARIGGAA